MNASRHNVFCVNTEHLQSNSYLWNHRRTFGIRLFQETYTRLSRSLKPHLGYQAGIQNHLSLEQHPKPQTSPSVLPGEGREKPERSSEAAPRGGLGKLCHAPSLRLIQQQDNLSKTLVSLHIFWDISMVTQPTPTFSPDGHRRLWEF